MKIELLTPVHIGTGYEIPLYEWKNFGSRFVRIDFSALKLSSLPSDTVLSDYEELKLWRQKLQEKELENAILYEARIAPNIALPTDPKDIFREQVKSRFSLTSILPGSSIKGAILTAYLYTRYIQKGWTKPTQFGGKEFDKKAMVELRDFARGRKNPESGESDISNRLKIGDIHFSADRLYVDVAVRKLKGRTLHTWVECLSSNTAVAEAKISQVQPSSRKVPQTLPLRQNDVEEICRRCNTFAKAVVNAEIDYFNYINCKYSQTFLPDFY